MIGDMNSDIFLGKSPILSINLTKKIGDINGDINGDMIGDI